MIHYGGLTLGLVRVQLCTQIVGIGWLDYLDLASQPSRGNEPFQVSKGVRAGANGRYGRENSREPVSTAEMQRRWSWPQFDAGKQTCGRAGEVRCGGGVIPAIISSSCS